MTTLTFVGNSHLASFKRAFERAQEADGSTPYETRFIISRWLASPWFDVVEHDFLRRPVYREDAPLSDVPDEVPVGDTHVLVIVGNGLLGDGIVRAYGTLESGRCEEPDGFAWSPVMPALWHHDVERGAIESYLARRNAPLISRDCAAAVHRNYLGRLTQHRAGLLACAGYARVLWVPAPDMTERVAGWRFSREYVESQCHCIHRQIAHRVLAELDPDFASWVVPLGEGSLRPSGFNSDDVAASAKAGDIHVSPAFYDRAVRQLESRLPPASG